MIYDQSHVDALKPCLHYGDMIDVALSVTLFNIVRHIMDSYVSLEMVYTTEINITHFNFLIIL